VHSNFFFLASSQFVQCIEQKYFESGYSQSECDSMHFCIERQFRHKNIALPSAYYECMRNANRKKPYLVQEFQYSDFIDFETTNKEFFKQNAFNGIFSVHHNVLKKSEGSVTVQFYDSINGDIDNNVEFKSYEKRGRNILNISRGGYVAPQCYDKPLEIDDLKKGTF